MTCFVEQFLVFGVGSLWVGSLFNILLQFADLEDLGNVDCWCSSFEFTHVHNLHCFMEYSIHFFF